MATSKKPKAAGKTTTKRKTTTKVAAKISGAGKTIPKKAKAPAKKKPAVAKKKLGNAKAKVKMTKTAAGSKDHWFSKLTKKAQAEYIKTHPNSKFAKGGVKAKKSAGAKQIAANTKAVTSMAAKHAKGLERDVARHKRMAESHKKRAAASTAKAKTAKTPASKAKHREKAKAHREAASKHSGNAAIKRKMAKDSTKFAKAKKTAPKAKKAKVTLKAKGPSNRTARASNIRKVPGRSKAKQSK